MSSPSVVLLSDVSIGFGTPQIISFAKSMGEIFSSKTLILEPDQPEKPFMILDENANFSLERIFTSTHPYSPSGQIEFNLHASERIDQLKPDIVILCAFLGAGAIYKMKHKPKLVIYYGIEHTDGTHDYEIKLLRLCSSKIDFSIFPEENRARLDSPRLNLHNKPFFIVYNGSSVSFNSVSFENRDGKFFYGGLLHPILTNAGNFFDGYLDDFEIDLFGNISGYTSAEEKITSLVYRKSKIRYNGYIPGGEYYLNILSKYMYSIVFWNPRSESTLYAAPNKFFDAIQAGVPIISAPHPLCKNLIRRYDCGIVMDDFSVEALIKALKIGQLYIKNGRIHEMIEKNLDVARKDLCWDRQFEKLIPQIKKFL